VKLLFEGDLLETAVDAHLHTLYHDPVALDGLGQLLLAFDIAALGALNDERRS
jgi:hypothetical protein